MAKQTIATGSAANDGTGDTLRQGADKVNSNFAEIYNYLGDGSAINSAVSWDSYNIIFDGSSIDANKTTLGVANPTAPRVVTIPNHSGDFVLDSATQTLTSKTLTAPVINNPIVTGFKFQDNDASHQYTIVPGALTSSYNVSLPNISAHDAIVFADATQTLTDKTLTGPTIDSAILNNDHELIFMDGVASAVNEITITNAATGNSPKISASGADTNVNLELDGKGNGLVVLSPAFASGTHNANGIIDSDTSVILFTGANHEAYLKPGVIAGDVKILLNTTTTADISVMRSTGAAVNLFRKGSGASAQMVIKPGGSSQLIWDGTYWNPVGFGFDSTGAASLVDL